MSPTQETHILTEMCFPYPGFKINSHKNNASDYDNLQVKEMSTIKQTFAS